jgi:hypothetical protein
VAAGPGRPGRGATGRRRHHERLALLAFQHGRVPGVQFRYAGVDVEGHDRRGAIADPADHGRELVGGPVVQQAAEQRGEGPARQHHRHVRAGRLRLGDGQLGGRPGDPAVRGVDHLQRHVLAMLRPLLPQLVRVRGVDHEVDRAQARRAQPAGVADRGERGQVDAIDEDQDHPPRIVRRLVVLAELPASLQVLQDLGFHPVYPVEPDEREHQHREDDDDHPGALGELHDREDQHDERGVDGGDGVDEPAAAPARFPDPLVVHGHAEARHREPGEHADRVERDQPVDLGAGSDQEDHRDDREHDDAVGQRQPVAPLGQPAGQERVTRDEAGQEREAAEAGVAAGVEDQRGGGLDHEVHEVGRGAEDDVGLLGEHRRVARLIGDGVRHVGEPGDAGDEERDDRSLGDQDLPGVAALGRLQGADGVGDRLDASKRGAAVGEGPQQHVHHAEAQQSLGAVPDRERRAGVGPDVAQPGGHLTDQADDDHQPDDAGEQVSRRREGLARLPDAAQVAVAHDEHGGH